MNQFHDQPAFTSKTVGNKLTGSQVLVYTKNGPGYVHDNIASAVNCIQELGKVHHFKVVVSDDPTVFNEANLKLTLSAELRFNLFGKFNGALFADAGNIWNVLDNTEDDSYTFNGISSLNTIALGTGTGIRGTVVH
jgi:hypothetical protein